MAGLAALDPARDARACRARSHRRHRTHRTPTTRRSDRPNLQRDPTSLHQIDHRTHPADHRSAGLVALATTPSTPRPCQPLPPARNSAHVITIYGWSTNGVSPQPDETCRGRLVLGAPVGWCDGALLGPCWYRSLAVVGFLSRPPDRSQP